LKNISKRKGETMKGKILFVALFVLLAALFSAVMVDAQGPKPGSRAPRANAGTAFTYQGQLKNGGVAVNGTCDIIFALYDAPTAGNQIGYAVGSPNPATVTNGLFTVQIDFGSAVIKGDAAWLLVSVRCPAGSGSFVLLDPRQPLTPAPMALALPGLYTKQNAWSPNIIGGYSGNVISDTVVGGTISGGGLAQAICGLFAHSCANVATDNFGTISGGYANQSGNANANLSDSELATVGGGYYNVASGSYSTISGGAENLASGRDSTVGGGWKNIASGMRATVPGGFLNTAQGDYSFAAGRSAKANARGTFVWADSGGADFTATITDSFNVRASGGITMYTNSAMSIGVSLNPSDSSWNVVSDRAAKENLTEVNSREILARVAALPMQTWNYKGGAIRHIGPMAQDFYAAFAVGPDDKHISTVDADGVALAAIQGLAQENQELKSQISNLESRLAALEQNAQATNPVHSNNLALIVVGVLLGIVVAQRMGQRGER
jgi:hypothetical protein